MALKALKDSLPWLAPSVAIVLAASGALDQNFFGFGKKDAAAPVPEAAAPILTAAAPAPAPQVAPAQQVVARADTGLLAAPAPRPAPAVDTSARDRQRALAAAAAARPTFGGGTAATSARTQCIEDLKSTMQNARVYFPSGGVSADAAGIEQGRLIGLIAQGCSDVRIRVEGHSDASGDPNANLRLSRARAEEVIKRIGASGIDTAMFVAEGVGSRVPSTVVGPEPRTYYDRRVEFSMIEDAAVQVVSRTPLAAQPWTASSCVADLQRAAQNTVLFYAPGSVSLRGEDYDTAMNLAEQAMRCPDARLRVVGRYSDAAGASETVYTGRLRAKAVMAMLVARGADAGQIILAAPSWAADSVTRTGLPGQRVDFDVILEDG